MGESSISADRDGEVTRLLVSWGNGDRQALDRLLPLVYEELRDLAGRYLHRERDGHTLPPTALVHEAYLRLAGSEGAPPVKTRGHFFAVAAQAMRRILVEHARRHAAARRPSPGDRVDFAGVLERPSAEPLLEILAVHEGLDRLRADHPRQAQVVEMRYFGGLTEDDVAEVLGISRPTVARDWRLARVLLARLLRKAGGDDPAAGEGELEPGA